MSSCTEGDAAAFDWAILIPKLVHPIRVAIIEAMDHVREPLSATDLSRLFDEQFDLSLVAYHLGRLAKFRVVKKVRRRQVRGAVETFYVLVR